MNLRTVRAESAEESNSNTSVYPFWRTATGEKPFQYADHYQFWDERTSQDRMFGVVAFGINDDEAHHDQKLKKNAHLVTN